jgi:hypothetical protein
MGRSIEQSVIQTAVLAASAAAGVVGFGVAYSDPLGPPWSTIFTILFAGGASCLLAAASARKWVLIAILCSWGAVTSAIMGVLMQQPTLPYLMLSFPLALATGYTGSRIRLAYWQSAG